MDAFDATWFGDANFPLSEDVFAALLFSNDNHVVVMPDDVAQGAGRATARGR